MMVQGCLRFVVYNHKFIIKTSIMKDLLPTFRYALVVLLSLAVTTGSCQKEDDKTPDDCSNGNTYRINNGMSCNNTPTASSVFQTTINGTSRSITFNYVPTHQVLGNVQANQRTFSVPANPTEANNVTQVANTSYTGGAGMLAYIFGIATTGVPFDPVANEPWVNTQTGAMNYEWNLEVLSANAGLVYDCNNAHDPNRYHYHGTPVQYIQTTGENGSQHSTLFGYAADGFPIYYKYGYADPNNANSSIVALTSSYQIKTGCRPGNGVSAPDGGYDGTYVADYEYVAGLGDLDECNGRWSKTPEYPNGTYVYYITDEFPSVPRCFKGTPSNDFIIGTP